MKTYSIREALALLRQNQWVNIIEPLIYRLLVEQKIIRQTLFGYEVIDRNKMRGIMLTHTGYHPKPLRENPHHMAPHTSVKLLENGIPWLAEFINKHYVEVIHPAPDHFRGAAQMIDAA